MAKSIEHILMSPNAFIVLTFAAFVIIVGWILSKTGLLNIHTSIITLGAADREREIIRQQVEWVRHHWEGFEATMPKPEGYDSWRGRFVAERVYDEFVDWITFNHISTSDTYVEVKQDKIISIVRQYTHMEEFHSKKFEDAIKKEVKACIERLVQIRELYK